MADNVAITAGSGTTIATDDVSSVHYQRVKLVDGTLDSTAAIPGDATNGLDVDVTRVQGTVTVSGTVTANAGTNLNTSSLALESGGNLATIAGAVRAEDAASADGHTGIPSLAVRKATPANTSNTDGDYEMLQMSAGRLWASATVDNGTGGSAVNIQDGGNSITVDGTITANAGSNLNTSALALESGGNLATLAGAVRAEDVASADGHTGIPAMAVRKATPANTSGADGDYEMLQVSAGRLWTSATIDAAIPAGTNNIGDVDVLTLPALPAGSNNIGDVDVLTLPSLPAGSNNIGDVDVLTLPNVTLAAGTNTNEVVGDVAQDAAIAGNPLSVGGRASSAVPTAMSADGDSVYAWHDRSGGYVINGRDAHDAALDSNTNPALIGGRASAAAPSDVSADGDAARAWFLRNGAQAMVVTAAGALIGGDATNGLDVDVTRVSGSVTTVDAGDVAHDAADSGNPVKVGGKAANAFPTAVANNDRANLITDLFGRLMTTHIDPAQQKHANKTYTSSQTGTDVITPTSGKKLAITSVVLGAYGTTAGRLILWFGDNADTTFTQDTDQVLVAASFAPSSTSKPGLIFTPAVPVFCTTADRELHITTDAALSVDVTIEYYEF